MRDGRHADGDKSYENCGDDAAPYATVRRDGILRVRRPGTEWLSTGWNGGPHDGPCAYNVSVPKGWSCDSIDEYVRDRLDRAGFDHDGPILLTGVDLEHARGARCGSVTVVATAGVSNPAALPMDPTGGDLLDGSSTDADRDTDSVGDSGRSVGTVNLILGTTTRLEAGALANLIAVAAEAKATTLLSETGFPGTTTDAVVVGHDPTGPSVEFSGSATSVGAAARACVRETLRASIRSRYADGDGTIPNSVADAEYGVCTDVRSCVFRPVRTTDEDAAARPSDGREHDL